MNELTGRDLDVAMAKALGWTEYTDGAFCTHGGWRKTDGEQTWLPAFSESVDALIRDVLPVCRERGMVEWRLVETPQLLYTGMISSPAVWHYAESDMSAAEALARACLGALETRG